MSSIARHQFPIIAWRKQQKLLWNPIHRKALKNRPEERVRLRVIEYLLETGWSRHRISTEETIRDHNQAGLRTDIICYSGDFEPKILTECKAENIRLSRKTAEQVARYNRQVNAPYVLLTNGRRDYWYRIDREDEKVEELESLPEILPPGEPVDRDFNYWKERGFAGGKAPEPLRSRMVPLLQHYAGGEADAVRYLRFKESPSGLDLDHYYHIAEIDDRKVALSFISTPRGESRMVAIFNEEGENRAVAETNLDLLFDGDRPNTNIYSPEGVRNIDLAEEDMAGFTGERPPPTPRELSGRLHRLFLKYLP